MNNLLLDFLSLSAILSGILVITSKNPVISVLFLISVFVNIACYLVIIGVGFVGISYIIVYIGAVAVLFLFVIMMLNVQLAELSAVGSEYTQNLPLGTIVGTLFLFELVSIMPFSFKDLSTFNLTNVIEESTSIFMGGFNWINSMMVNTSTATTHVHIVFDQSSGTESYFVNYIQIQSIGQNLYTYGSIWLFITSILLLLAMIGPITLSINKFKAQLSPYLIFQFFSPQCTG